MNENLLSERQKLVDEINGLTKENEKIKSDLILLKEKPLNDGLEVVKFKGLHKKLVNFSNKVSAIECDLNTLRINFPSDCFIRVATVLRLNFTEILRLLEDYNQNIFFAHDNGKTRIYIGPTNSQELLDQIKASSFKDAYRDCQLRTEVNLQPVTEVPKVNPARIVQNKPRPVSPIEIGVVA